MLTALPKSNEDATIQYDDLLSFEELQNCAGFIDLNDEGLSEDFVAASFIAGLNEDYKSKSSDMESGTKYRNSLLPPISPCSSPMLHEIKVEKDCDLNSHHPQQQQRPNTLSAATTCFIDESLTSLDWLIELDINQLTTVPQTNQNRGCRGAECKALLSMGGTCCCDDANCNLPATDRRSSEWATNDVRHYSGLPKKPDYSYPELIFMAMQDAPNNQITVAGIYSWIKEKFPFYLNHSTKTWQVG